MANARQAATAGARSGSRVGAGQRTAIATIEAAAAMPQPASRSGIEAAVPGSDSGRMNASSSDVEAAASTELTTPAKSTQKATSAIAIAASHGSRDARVPTHTRTPPASASVACDCSRSRIGPLKSTSTSVAKDPKAANVATLRLPMTRSPSANSDGMTIAARAARRSAARSRSRVRSQRTNMAAVSSARARRPRSGGPSSGVALRAAAGILEPRPIPLLEGEIPPEGRPGAAAPSGP